MKNFVFIIAALLFIFSVSCVKNKINICQEFSSYYDRIIVKELVYDSLMITDTSFTYIPISFALNNKFENGNWEIAQNTYSGIFLSPKPFVNQGNYDIHFKGTIRNQCSGIEKQQELATNLFILSKDDPNNRKISPYVGDYLGSINTNPADTFRVKIGFFSKETKPNWQYWIDHSNQPFYWISNFPKGFQNWSSEGRNYPELSNGYEPFITYKNLCVTDGYIIAKDNTAHNIKGYSSLKNRDSLIIEYLVIDTTIYNQSKQIKYIKQKFSGIRK